MNLICINEHRRENGKLFFKTECQLINEEMIALEITILHS